MLSIQDIYSSFQKLETNQEKVDYLLWLKSKDFDYAINYDNLIKYYTNEAELENL